MRCISRSRSVRPQKVRPASMYGDVIPGCVTQIGSRDSGMAVVTPFSDDPTTALLNQLDNVLRREESRRLLDKLIEADDESVRLIQAGRYEIFIDAQDQPNTAFRMLTNKMPIDTKERIIRHARRTSLRDPRLREGPKKYKFGNFSLIATYDLVPAQAPHIDVVLPNYQFGLTVTDRTPSTQIFDKKQRIRTADALVDIWVDRGNYIGKKIPPNIAHAIRTNPEVLRIVESFGDVMLPHQIVRRMKGCPHLPTGTVTSIPGTVVHAGPMTDGFRAIIFYSAWPVGSSVAAYHPDTQFSGVTMVGHLLHLLWHMPYVGYQDRLFLLHIFEQYISESPVGDLHLHFAQGPISTFVSAMETGNLPGGMIKEQYIDSAAKNTKFCELPNRDGWRRQLGKLISVPGLLTSFEGKLYDIAVYQRDDGTVFMRFLDEGLPFEAFEGVGPEDSYTLIMNESSDESELYDGTNGCIYDNDKELVLCGMSDEGGSLTKKRRTSRKRKKARLPS